jgi:hypothetical protein
MRTTKAGLLIYQEIEGCLKTSTGSALACAYAGTSRTWSPLAGEIGPASWGDKSLRRDAPGDRGAEDARTRNMAAAFGSWRARSWAIPAFQGRRHCGRCSKSIRIRIRSLCFPRAYAWDCKAGFSPSDVRMFRLSAGFLLPGRDPPWYF